MTSMPGSSSGSTPPPPPPFYGYPPPPPPQRPGLLAGLTKVGGLISIAALLFLVGFYTALGMMGSDHRPTATTYRAGKGADRIAIIPVNGTIGGETAEFIRKAVDAVIDDPSIKSVVLRVESPGGSASSSDQILHELNRLRTARQLPIVASYGGYAASGGYYVSCQADKIFAEPTCITGSIGVIAQVPTMQELLQDKLGVKMEVITSNGSTEKDTANNVFRDWTEKDRTVLRGMMDAIHTQFVDVVAEGRKGVLTREAVQKVATGKIFTANGAKEAGLIDAVGYLDAAIEEARTRGNIAAENPPVIQYQPRVGLGGLLGLSGPNVPATLLGGFRVDGASVRQILAELSVPQMMLLLQP